MTSRLTMAGQPLAAQRRDELTHAFLSYASWQGLLVIAASLSLAKLLRFATFDSRELSLR